jgi:ribosomal protein S18 acetylase RimI-like enzyme
MAQALASLREEGFQEAVLWVLERNTRARQFYEAGGWGQEGEARTQWHGGIALREVRYRLRANLGLST